MSANPQPVLSPEQYLEIERAAEHRSEYYNGHMYAMAGASPRHAFLVGNLIGLLHGSLRKGPCSAASSDLRVRVSTELYTYPDVVVVCGDPEFADQKKDTVTNPAFLAEVLSPSTEAYDRGLKSTLYRAIASLQEYALISQFEPRVEVFRRQAAGGWLLSDSAGMDAVCRLTSLGCQIPLAELYEKISFEEVAPPIPPQ